MRALFYLAILATVFYLTACGPDYKKRYDTPLTYAQAMKQKSIDFPLPPSSHGIHYAMYGDWQAYQRLVRFEAPVEDCIRHIDAVLAWDDKLYNRTSSYMFGVHSDQSGERNVPLTVGHFRHSRL